MARERATMGPGWRAGPERGPERGLGKVTQSSHGLLTPGKQHNSAQNFYLH